MNYPREQIYAAFFDVVRRMSGIKYAARRMPVSPNIEPDSCPALFVEQTGENPIYRGRGIPYSWELDVVVSIHVWSGDPAVAPATLLNPYLDALEALVTGSPPLTLGGKVSEVRLLGEGKATMGATLGSIGNKAVAFIPVRIVTV